MCLECVVVVGASVAVCGRLCVKQRTLCCPYVTCPYVPAPNLHGHMDMLALGVFASVRVCRGFVTACAQHLRSDKQRSTAKCAPGCLFLVVAVSSNTVTNCARREPPGASLAVECFCAGGHLYVAALTYGCDDKPTLSFAWAVLQRRLQAVNYFACACGVHAGEGWGCMCVWLVPKSLERKRGLWRVCWQCNGTD